MTRAACLVLLIAAASLSGGCAVMIARSGKDLTDLTTKVEVHAALGEPDAVGADEGGAFEEFRTHRKIADYGIRYAGPGYAMGLVMTCGLIDLILVPQELYLAGRRSILGQTIRVSYDDDGVKGIALDGEPFWFHHRPEAREGSSDEAKPPASQ